MGQASDSLTRQGGSAIAAGVFSVKTDRPYFDAWLRRTGRQFAISGRLTQVAGALAVEQGGTVEDWRARLRSLLNGGEMPSIELLTRIDALLSGPSKAKRTEDFQGLLF